MISVNSDMLSVEETGDKVIQISLKPSVQSSIQELEVVKKKVAKKSINSSVRSSVDKKNKVVSLKTSRAFIEESKNRVK
jgi:hypothetical protein